MKNVIMYFTLIMLSNMISVPLHAQIPNAGFESWTGGEPNNWITNNTQGFLVPVTQSDTAHGGAYALRGTVIHGFGITAPPFIFSGDSTAGIPVSVRHGSLNGFYQFESRGDDILQVFVVMFNNGTYVGAGEATLAGTSSQYAPFSCPISYLTPDTPDTCIIQIGILDTLSGIADIGSFFLLDDVSFGSPTAIASGAPTGLAASFTLHQNYPNPFNPVTHVKFEIQNPEWVTLIVYDLLGHKVVTLVNESLPSGSYTAKWDGTNDAGQPVVSGVYLYRLVAGAPATGSGSGGFAQTRKMMLVR